MPKETKKFINPLLRPSQEVEIVPPKPQKKAVPEAQSSEIGNVSKEAEQPAFSEKPPEKEVPHHNLPPSTQPTPTSTSSDTSTFTYPETEQRQEEKKDDNPKSVQKKSPFLDDTIPFPERDDELETQTSAARILMTISPSATYLAQTTEPEVASRRPSTETATHTEMATSTFTYPETEMAVNEEIQQNTVIPSSTEPEKRIEAQDPALPISEGRSITKPTEPVREEKKARPSFTASESARRKRGPQAFEKTHERITLWIDKGLKQAFEELAYEQELPKTALLNEAIADLLRKYDLQ